MLSSGLNSPLDIQINIEIIRAFVRLPKMLMSNAQLARKLADLEKKDDARFKVVFDAIRPLMKPPKPGNYISTLREFSRHRAAPGHSFFWQVAGRWFLV
jgi:hypothetical protein